MRIAIIGSHKIGKTTLFNALKEELSQDIKFHFVEEIALTKIAEAKSFFEYMKIQEDILEAQLRIHNWGSDSIIVTDRCLIDNLAYMINGRYSPYTYALPGSMKENLDMLQSLSNIVTTSISKFYDYDVLLYLSIEFKLGVPTREQLVYQWNIAETIKYLLRNYGIPYYKVTGTTNERLKYSLKIISEQRASININQEVWV